MNNIANHLTIKVCFCWIAGHTLQGVAHASPLLGGVRTAANSHLSFGHQGRKFHTGIVRYTRKSIAHGAGDGIANIGAHAWQQHGYIGHIASVDLYEVGQSTCRSGGELEGLHRRHALEVGQLFQHQALQC